MSSMRSASSSTTKRVWSSTIERSSIRSVSRPGVATTTSTPRRHRPHLGAARHAAEDQQRREPRAAGEARGRPPRSARRARGSARASARGRSSAPAACPSSRSWCRIGSAKAAVLPVPVWAMPRMSRPASCGGDRLRLDRRRRVEAHAGEAVGQRLGEAEVREGGGRHNVPFRAAVAAAVCRPRQAHVTKTD